MTEWLGGAEWQTVLLYVSVAVFVICAFAIWQRKNEKPWLHFHVVGLIADKVEGNWHISQTKFQSFGAFVISSIGVVVCVIRGTVPPEFVALLTIYGGIYVLGRIGQQSISARADVDIRKAEINRGRSGDVDIDVGVPTVEEEESQRPKYRRRKSDSVIR